MTAEETMQPNAAITIRRVDVTEADRERLQELSERDSRRIALDGPVIGLEVEGRLLAAISLSTGELVADPFSRTAELRQLLELRVAQLRRRLNGRPDRTWSLGRHRVPALGGSPAGQILTLPRWG